jgi:hypothetical protein
VIDEKSVLCRNPTGPAIVAGLAFRPQNGSIFFSPAVISEVIRIRASFPGTDTFEPYDSHYLSLVEPLKKFMAQAASDHLRCLIERVNEIEARNFPVQIAAPPVSLVNRTHIFTKLFTTVNQTVKQAAF